MLTALRCDLKGLFARFSFPRPPALRRADSHDWLFATDAPLLLNENTARQLVQLLTENGWQCENLSGWLYLDHALPLPARTPLPAAAGEAACLLSLLQRHPSVQTDPAACRMLAKAAEQSPEQLERACAALHARYAAFLREHRPLPGDVLRVLAALLCTQCR